MDVQLWMRGQSVGQTAEVTIDFRNQTMWSDPIASERWTVELTSEWTQVSFSATAPVDGAFPVFHTRLTIQAGADATVELDGIQMQTTGL